MSTVNLLIDVVFQGLQIVTRGFFVGAGFEEEIGY
jgi:hypothetical protein